MIGAMSEKLFVFQTGKQLWWSWCDHEYKLLWKIK